MKVETLRHVQARPSRATGTFYAAKRTVEHTYSSLTANCDVGESQVKCFADAFLISVNLSEVKTTTASSQVANGGLWVLTGPTLPRPHHLTA